LRCTPPPKNLPPHPRPRPKNPSLSNPYLCPMRKINVLIIEDEVVIAKNIAYYLEQLGCEISGILTTGEEALPFLEQESVDVLMVDISLRGELDGVQTVHLIKEKYDTPVIFLP